MGPPVLSGGAPAGPGQHQQIVRGAPLIVDGLKRSILNVNSAPLGDLDHGFVRVKCRRHPPGAGIGFGECDELSSLCGGLFDELNGVVDVFFIIRRHMAHGLNNGNAKAQ